MLELLRLFVQVVEEQSFTSVARRLGVSQPAVSNQIRVLEEKLGFKLLYRKGKGLGLTPQGEVTFQRAKRILEEWSLLREEISGLSSELAGKVHIGASHIPGEYLLPYKIAAFKTEFPSIKFKLTIGDSLEIADKLAAQELDFAVVGAAFDTDRLRSELWLRDELNLVVSAEHALGELDLVQISDLVNYPMILREAGSGHRRALEEALLGQGLSLEDFPLGLEISSTEGVKNAIRAGLGYSFLSASAIQPHDEGLKPCQVGLNLERGFYLLTMRHKTLSLAAKTCYAFLLENCV